MVVGQEHVQAAMAMGQGRLQVAIGRLQAAMVMGQGRIQAAMVVGQGSLQAVGTGSRAHPDACSVTIWWWDKGVVRQPWRWSVFRQ